MKSTLKDLIPDPKNANRHSEFGTGLLENSTRANGFGRSILVSEDNVIIAGNGVAEAAAAIGMERINIVETDGQELVVVKRKDIKSGTPEFYNMALADNLTALKNIVMDAEVVDAIVHEHPETKFWANLVNNEKEEGDVNDGDATSFSFQVTPLEARSIKRALKQAKTKLKKGEKTNAAALVVICKQFLSINK